MSRASDAVRARLARLLVEVRTERRSLDRKAARLARYQQELVAAPTDPVAAMVAMDLHGYYTAAEALFERVSRGLDDSAPGGADWHRELVDQMAADLEPVRPAVIDEELRIWLHDLRRFRHFFRHAYAVELDPRHLGEHASSVQRHHGQLGEAIDRTVAFVSATLGTLGE